AKLLDAAEWPVVGAVGDDTSCQALANVGQQVELGPIGLVDVDLEVGGQWRGRIDINDTSARKLVPQPEPGHYRERQRQQPGCGGLIGPPQPKARRWRRI